MPAWSAVVATAVLGAAGCAVAYVSARDAAGQANARVAETVVRRIDETQAQITGGLVDLGSFFEASDAVEGDEFRRYTRSLLVKPGVVAVGYIPRVPAAGVAAWQRSTGLRLRDPVPGAPRVVAAPLGRDAFPLLYRAFNGTSAAVPGTDIGREPSRWRAMSAARDSGGVRATAPVRLIGIDAWGFTYFAPVYRGASIPRDVAARRARLAGFVSVVQTADTFRDALHPFLPDEVGYRITDGATVLAAETPPPTGSPRAVTVAGRLWWVTVSEPTRTVWTQTLVAALMAVLGTGLVAAWALQGGRRERYAQAVLAQGLRERDAAERALAESEEHYRVVVTSSADAIVSIDEAGTVLTANEAVRDVLGWEPHELIGRNVSVLMPPDQRIRHDRHVERRAAGAPPRVIGTARDVVALHRDGTRLTVLISLSEARVGEQRVFTAIIHDMTERVRAERRSQRFGEEQAAHLRIATAVAGDESGRAVLNRAAEEAAGLVGAMRAAVLRREGDTLRTVAAWSEPGVAGPAIGSVEPLPADGPPTAGSEAAADRVVPITIDGGVWGYLAVAGSDGEAFAADSAGLLARLAALTGLAITSIEARRQLSSLASTDHLTGLWNRRAFHARLAEEVARARRNGTPLALAVIDIDHFKQVNDTFGHPVGDQVLAEFARRLREAVRAGETLARVGGEEFAWIIPDGDGMQAFAGVERARQAVSATPFAGVGRITVSAGLCDLAEAGSPDELFRNADMSLYWAKNAGRDRCFRYSKGTLHMAPAGTGTGDLVRVRAAAAIQALARTIDARDQFTSRHSERVAELASCIARARGWADDRVEALRDAALVHDVGKIGVPDAILFKAGPLTAGERLRVQQHVSLSARMVADILDDEQTEWVRHHHERVDGGGYPDGARGDALSEGARILALCDAWDAMTAGRPYGAPLDPAEALVEVERHEGTQFCPEVVGTLRHLWAADEPLLRTRGATA